ncbi:MAG: amidohydrolase family protein [Deltaproteobacteria bacterium]|nr:amidohydrolase family protein [Deltaproteobacteria bacterium]MCW5803112.1 amidohydrolase family protein [Deltaproteobacteria bacterium]
MVIQKKTCALAIAVALAAGTSLLVATREDPSAAPAEPAYLANDSHVHLTNYVQVGTDIHDFLRTMDGKIGRAVLFGIPLQQMWSYRLSQEDAPTYYLDSDAPLYYYSFTDAAIAMAFRSLSPRDRARFDPMITGFNPADMYAADHVRRVLLTYPGVFEGIGEFSIHKEFVTSKVAGGAPSLEDPALDRLLSFAEEVGLVVLVHCDADTPFPQPGATPAYLAGLRALFERHPRTTIIWAHIGVGRVVRPIKDHMELVDRAMDAPELRHVMVDLSWAEVAKYVVASPEAVKTVAAVIEHHPDRFLFGTDEVAPKNQREYLRVYEMYEPLWRQLSPRARELVLRGNYERIFDQARHRVRAWEEAHKGSTPSAD